MLVLLMCNVFRADHLVSGNLSGTSSLEKTDLPSQRLVWEDCFLIFFPHPHWNVNCALAVLFVVLLSSLTRRAILPLFTFLLASKLSRHVPSNVWVPFPKYFVTVAYILLSSPFSSFFPPWLLPSLFRTSH